MPAPKPNRRPALGRGVDLAGAYAKLGSSKRAGGTSHYRDPDVLRTVAIPGGGELRLEALRAFGGDAPIIRWVATYMAGGAHCTTERYLQVPHQGFDVLEEPDAAREIEGELRQMLENIKRERLTSSRTT